MHAEPAAARPPLRARGVGVQPGHVLPRLAAVIGAQQRGGHDSRPDPAILVRAAGADVPGPLARGKLAASQPVAPSSSEWKMAGAPSLGFAAQSVPRLSRTTWQTSCLTRDGPDPPFPAPAIGAEEIDAIFRSGQTRTSTAVACAMSLGSPSIHKLSRLVRVYVHSRTSVPKWQQRSSRDGSRTRVPVVGNRIYELPGQDQGSRPGPVRRPETGRYWPPIARPCGDTPTTPPPRCGVTITAGRSAKGLRPSVSCSSTSNAAPRRCSRTMARRSAASSTRPPRAVLMRYEPCGIAASSSSPRR